MYCNGDAIHYYCPDPTNALNMLGLIVGIQGQPVVITGFTARSKYWLDKVTCKQVP
jgi:hypothetical protein